MKKLALAVASILLVACFSTSALASQNTPTYKSTAGITPYSIFYPIGNTFDHLKIFLKFNEYSKAKIEIQIAEKKLGYINLLVQKGKTDLAVKALNDYGKYINDVYKNLNNAIEKDKYLNGNIKSDVTIKAAQAIVLNEENSIKTLTAIEEKLDGNAKQVVQNIIAMQQAEKEAVSAIINAKQELNSAKKDLIAAKVQLKKAEKSGIDADIKTAQSNLTEKTAAYNQQKDLYNKALEQLKAATSDKTIQIQDNNTIKVVGSSLSTDPKSDKSEVKSDDKTTSNKIVCTEVKNSANTNKVNTVVNKPKINPKNDYQTAKYINGF